MGLPARQIDNPEPRSGRRRTPLSVVRGSSRRRTRPCDRAAAARDNFRLFVVVTLVVCALGLGRVWLSVQAAEASLEAGRLRGAIKTERYRGDMLEVQQSALSSPSRIRAIAGATMNMAASGRVTYIDLKPEATTLAQAPKTAEQTGLERALDDVLSLAAGEAQVLLVGDVGLASAR